MAECVSWSLRVKWSLLGFLLLFLLWQASLYNRLLHNLRCPSFDDWLLFNRSQSLNNRSLFYLRCPSFNSGFLFEAFDSRPLLDFLLDSFYGLLNSLHFLFYLLLRDHFLYNWSLYFDRCQALNHRFLFDRCQSLNNRSLCGMIQSLNDGSLFGPV